MPNRGIQADGRRGDHKPSGPHRRPQAGIRPLEFPPPDLWGSAPLSNDHRRRACDASSSVELAILQIVRDCGGRLLLADLVFQIRWRGMRSELIEAVLEELVARGLLRGPLSQSAAYELTAAGWDVSAVGVGRI